MPSSTSPIVQIETPTLTGVWIHDPDDPEGTVRQYAFGAAGRAGELDVEATALAFVGRAYPVYDFGEQQAQRVALPVHIPFGTDEISTQVWQDQLNALLAFSQSRKTLCYRDGRGRRIFGVMVGCKDTDTATGTDVAITVDRTDYDESVA